MSITKNHESRYVTVLDNPLILVIDVGPNIAKKILVLILSNDLENLFNGNCMQFNVRSSSRFP